MHWLPRRRGSVDRSILTPERPPCDRGFQRFQPTLTSLLGPGLSPGAVEHARHTIKKPGAFAPGFWGSKGRGRNLSFDDFDDGLGLDDHLGLIEKVEALDQEFVTPA